MLEISSFSGKVEWLVGIEGGDYFTEIARAGITRMGRFTFKWWW